MMVIKLEQSQCWRRSDPRASRSRRRTKRDIRRSKEKEKVGAAHSHKAVPYLLLLAADASRDTIAPEGARTGPDPAEGWSEGEEEQRIEPRRPRYRALAGWYNEDDRAGSWRWPRLTATMTHPQRGYACNTRDTQGPRRWSGGGDAVSNRPRGQAVRGRPSERKPGCSRSTAALPKKKKIGIFLSGVWTPSLGASGLPGWAMAWCRGRAGERSHEGSSFSQGARLGNRQGPGSGTSTSTNGWTKVDADLGQCIVWEKPGFGWMREADTKRRRPFVTTGGPWRPTWLGHGSRGRRSLFFDDGCWRRGVARSCLGQNRAGPRPRA